MILLVGGVIVVNNALFNGMKLLLRFTPFPINTVQVDGGHRAIKYTRIGGVKSDIFNEGILGVLLQV